MPTPRRRLLVVLGAALGASLPALPAAADTVPSCPPGSAVFSGAGVTVAVHHGDRVNVCVTDAGLGGLVVSFSNEASSPLVPLGVSRMPGECADAVVRTTWPVALTVTPTATSTCVGLNGLTTTVSYGPLGYDPDVQVWRTGTGATIDQVFCLDKFVGWHLYEPAYDEWVECVNQPHRIA